MLRYTFTFVLLTVFQLVGFTQQKFNSSIYFETNKHTISKSEVVNIKKYIDQIELKNIQKIEIKGFTDTIGSKQFNINLSNLRANELRKQLINLGVDSTKIFKISKGESLSLSKNGLDVLTNNRRVDISFQYKSNDYIGELLQKLETKPESFWINPLRDTFIVTKSKATFFIPANSFNTANNKKINLQIKSLNTKSGMILNNIHTMSNQEILESAGMFDVKAFQNKMELDKKLNNPILLIVPTDSTKNPNMEFFYGEHDTLHNFNWSLSNNANPFNPNFIFNSNWSYRRSCEFKLQPPIAPNFVPELMYAYNNIKDSVLFLTFIKHAKCLRQASKKQSSANVSMLNIDTLSFILAAPSDSFYFEKETFVKNVKLNLKRRYLKLTKKDDLLANLDFKLDYKKILNKKPPKKDTLYNHCVKLCKEHFALLKMYDSLYLDYKLCLENDSLLRAIAKRDSTTFANKTEAFLKKNKLPKELNYVFKMDYMGIINCDFFNKFQNVPKVNYVVNATLFNANFSMIFKNRNINLKPKFLSKEQIVFYQVPVGEEVILVAINNEFKVPKLFIKEFKTEENTKPIQPEYKEMNIKAMKEEILKLDK